MGARSVSTFSVMKNLLADGLRRTAVLRRRGERNRGAPQFVGSA
jgi:hypothetical protein